MILRNNCDPEISPEINESAYELWHIYTGQKTTESGRSDQIIIQDIHENREDLFYSYADMKGGTTNNNYGNDNVQSIIWQENRRFHGVF